MMNLCEKKFGFILLIISISIFYSKECIASKKIKVVGELQVIYKDDFKNPQQSRLEKHIITKSGKTYKIKDDQNSIKLQHGQKVTLSGTVTGPLEDETLLLGAENAPSYGTVPGTLTNTFGEQKVLVIMVNFQDNPIEPWTKEDVANSFVTADRFMREASYGKTWLRETITNWITIPISGATCLSTDFTKLAKEHAAAAGYDLNTFDRLAFTWPVVSDCGWGGLGSVGGKPSYAWFNGSGILRPNTLVHELGHNLGLHHTHELKCSGTTLGDNCAIQEYGNRADAMGLGSGHYNASQKMRLGWLEDKILTITQSGTYQIAPFEFLSEKPLALRIFKRSDSVYNDNDWYYLEFRQPIGFDTGLGNSFWDSYNWTDAVTIHSAYERFGNFNYLLDMNPQTSGFHDASLNPGQTYKDDMAGISITTNWTDTSGAEVTIILGDTTNTPCTPAPPSLTIMNLQDNTASAGTALFYSVKVTNHDSNECLSRDFQLNATAPSGWTSSFNISNLNVSPGQSLSATLSVISSANASSGSYEIPLSATSGANKISEFVTYNVENITVNNSPIAKDDIAVTDYETPITINVLANDSDSDGDILKITSLSGVSGTAKITPEGSIHFTPNLGFSGVESFTYTISDSKGATASATVSVTVNPAPEPPPIETDVTNPTITITSPTNGTTVSNSEQVTITAQASDDKKVTKVEFYINQVLKCSVLSEPYICSYTISKKDSSTISVEARAYDAAGNIAQSFITLQKQSTTGGARGKGRKK